MIIELAVNEPETTFEALIKLLHVLLHEVHFNTLASALNDCVICLRIIALAMKLPENVCRIIALAVNELVEVARIIALAVNDAGCVDLIIAFAEKEPETTTRSPGSDISI